MIALHATGRGARAAMLGVACGLTAVCAACSVTASLASHASRAPVKATSKRICAYEIATPTAAEIAAINRYWTPLARSSVTLVSRGKILVPTPRKHLSPAQRQALARAKWAWRAFSPKPELVCAPVPAGQTAGGATTTSRRAAGKRG